MEQFDYKSNKEKKGEQRVLCSQCKHRATCVFWHKGEILPYTKPRCTLISLTVKCWFTLSRICLYSLLVKRLIQQQISATSVLSGLFVIWSPQQEWQRLSGVGAFGSGHQPSVEKYFLFHPVKAQRYFTLTVILSPSVAHQLSVIGKSHWHWEGGNACWYAHAQMHTYCI